MKLEVGKVYEIDGIKHKLNSDYELIELPKSIYDTSNITEYYTVCYPTIHRFRKEFVDEEYFITLLKNDLEHGNAFLTKEEAEFELEKRKTIAKIKKWKYENDDYKFTSGENNYIVHINSRGNIAYDHFLYIQDLPSCLYFSSEEKAEECLEYIGVDNWKKYILEIEA